MVPEFEDNYIVEPKITSLESIQENYPTLSIEDITLIYEVSGRNYGRVIDCLTNQSLDNLIDLLYSNFIAYCTEESPKLNIE